MCGSQSSQQHPSGAPVFPSMPNHMSHDRRCMTMDAPYNFSGTGGDQSHLSPLSTLEPGLPPQDDVFGGGSWERSVLPHEQQTPSHPSMRAPSVPNFAPGRSPYLGHSDSRMVANRLPAHNL
ncbi:hypothetical protein F4604DRAFT_1921444 [Suillus subluteus]|nr:hypothetical protein F4604DRAFT_1921444 [Suillus subluteus]